MYSSAFWVCDPHWPVPMSNSTKDSFTNTLRRLYWMFWRKNEGVFYRWTLSNLWLGGVSPFLPSPLVATREFHYQGVLKSLSISLLFGFSSSLQSNEFLYSYTVLLCSLVQAQIFAGYLYSKCLTIYCLYKENPFLRGMLLCGSNRSPPGSQHNIYSSLFFKELKS